MRNVQDPQIGSKILVDHALARFSTDNLSCMMVRLDSAALKVAQDSRDHLIGVEGDPPTLTGGISETEAIVSGQTTTPLASSTSNVGTAGAAAAAAPSPDTSGILHGAADELQAEIKKNNDQAPTPELNPAAVEAARKDNK